MSTTEGFGQIGSTKTARKLVVFEGLDETGKTSASRSLLQAFKQDHKPLYIHMPTGLVDWSARAYELLEKPGFIAPLPRQLLHLACHAENVPRLQRALLTRTVFLDRWWWSTLAYGSAAGLEPATLDVLASVAHAIWHPISPDLIFLFDEPHRAETVEDGVLRSTYRMLAKPELNRVIHVPRMSSSETLLFLVSKLKMYGVIDLEGF